MQQIPYHIPLFLLHKAFLAATDTAYARTKRVSKSNTQAEKPMMSSQQITHLFMTCPKTLIPTQFNIAIVPACTHLKQEKD